VLLLPILRVGVPAYMHDWTWAPDPAGLRAQMLQGWEAWLDDGLGRPNAFPTALPFFVAMGLATPVVPPRVELALLLVAILAGAFCAATVFARRVYRLGTAAYVCGALYAASPVVLTKLVAGHLPYLEAYAAFPVFALGLREAGRSVRWAAGGALAVAFTVLQPQYLGFDVVYALAALATGTASWRGALRLAAFALPVILPVLVGPTVNALGGNGVLAQQHAVVAWERDQSSDPVEAIAGIGYFTHYVTRLAPPGASGLFAVFPLLALAGLVAARRTRDAWTLAAAAAAGWLIVTGLKGPLAPALAPLFADVTPASLFRELYDASVLIWLPFATGVAVATTRFGVPALAVAGATMLAALAPPWALYGRYFGEAPEGATLARLSAAVPAAARGAGRVVWWPALQPIGPGTGEERGSDPLARTPLDGALPLYEYQPEGLNGEAVSLAAAGRWRTAAGAFAQLGVRYVVVRAGIDSFASGRPRPTIPPDGALPKVLARDGFTVYAVPGARALVSVERAPAAPAKQLRRFAPSRTDAVAAPSRIVAAFPYAWRTAAASACGVESVIGGGATLARAGGPWILAAPLDATSCEWLPASRLAAQPRRLFVAAGSANAPAPLAKPGPSLAAASAIVERPGRWSAHVEAPRDAVLVVRVAFDRRWRARADGRDLGPPSPWFGFLAWPLAPGAHDVVATYGGTPPVIASLAVSLLAMIALAGVIVVTTPGAAIRRGESRR